MVLPLLVPEAVMSRLLIVLALTTPLRAAEQVTRSEHVTVQYEGVPEEYAKAVARVVEAARAAADNDGFAIPKAIEVRARIDPAGAVQLFNDGQSYFFLSVRSEKGLRKPADSGTFHIYGLCHEVAHLAMYRVIADRRWMTTAAAEGWAHFLGSRLVDRVAEKEGAELWPDRYDYADDGTKRLKRQLTAKDVSPTVRGAALWQDLFELVGAEGMIAVFAAWGKAKVDPAEPGKALGEALTAAVPDQRRKEVAAWWVGAAPTMVVSRPASDFPVRTVKRDELTAKPRELAHDDGTMTGKRSIAGGGHAVRFESPGEGRYLVAVKLHGSRYGTTTAPEEQFTVYLCDEKLRSIAAFSFPYATFERGNPEWVTLDVPPTHVPAKFIICVEFNPTARKGVFVSHDAAGSGASLTGLPGDDGRKFTNGDWMIRALVDAPTKRE